MLLKTRSHGFTAWVNLRLLQLGQPLLKNVFTPLLNVIDMVNLLSSFTGAAHQTWETLDGLAFAQQQNQVQKLIRELKKNEILPDRMLVDSRLFAMRNADHISDLLWRLVCHDIWFVWKQGATILQNEYPDPLVITPFTIIEREPKIRSEKPAERGERRPSVPPSPESCILDMVITQLKMTSEGRRINCRTLSDLTDSHVLCALLNAFVPEMFTLEILINDRWTTNLVLKTMEEIFQVTSPFSCEDLMEGDKMAVCAYFCFFFMAACRYRQYRAVTRQYERMKGEIRMLENLIANTLEPSRVKTLTKKCELIEKVRNLTKNCKILEKKFDPKSFSDWMQHVESVKKKTLATVRNKIVEKYEAVHIPRDITIAKLCHTTGINLSLTKGHGYYLCQTPEMLPENRDIVLKDKSTGIFIHNNQNNKREIRTSIGLWPGIPSQLDPTKYPEYEIYVESTSKNKLLPNGCKFLYQLFPSSDVYWKQKFLKAAKENDSDMVLRMAIFFKTDPDFINWKEPKYGYTALHYASRSGDKDTVQRLLECNADFDCQNKTFYTPLHLAVACRHRTIIHMLIEWGCDVFLKNNKQETAIEIAKTPKLKRFIIETYNHYLLTMPAIMNGDPDLLLRLIKDHMNRKKLFCSLRSRCVSGSTLLHTAVHWRDTESIDYLLQLGVDPDIRDYKGATPIHRARDIASLAILLEAGASIDAEDNDGNTPLHIKCYELEEESSNLEIISFLIERGADILKRNKTGLLPVHCCAMRGRMDVIDYHLKVDSQGVIANALAEGHTLLSLMYLALTGGFLSCAHWLLEKGFRLLEGESEKLLFEIVTKSLKASNTDDILAFLFNYGVDVNCQFQDDNTALHYVCSLGSSDFALKGLLEQGASLDILNEASLSPLMIAVKANNLKTVAILVQAGGDMMAENENGECSLDVVQDPAEWIKSDHFPETIKEIVRAHYWQEARSFIHRITSKVRPETPASPIKVLPFGQPTKHSNRRGTLSPVQRPPSIFITSEYALPIPDPARKAKKIPNLG